MFIVLLLLKPGHYQPPKMKVSWSLLGLSLLYLSVECLLPPTKEELNQISLLGEKYLDKQIENAITGVKEMKTVMERTEEDHKRFRSELEKTKQQKENALMEAQEMEEKLTEQQSVCNETMQALWEECKPCLRKACVKYYSRTCSSGAGLVGRQLEEVLNRTSPISIWINGQNIETLLDEDQQQTRRFQDLEERYTEVADGVDNIFMDSMKVFDHMRSFHQPSFFPSSFRMPSMFGSHSSRAARVYRSPLHNQDFHSFHSMFRPMMDMARNMFDSFGPYMGSDMDFPSEDNSVIIHSIPCDIKIRALFSSSDCSGKRPLEGPLKEDLERALARAERFTQEYNSLLKRFEDEMFNTSSVLDMFNKQFGWVSSLANHTKNEEGFFKIQAAMSKGSDNGETAGDTKVSVKLFDGPDMSFTVPGDIPWSDPKFSEVVAQEALDRYKQNTV
uniref:Clusterin n=1 Tax=Cyprinus carpio TaxID=7962 RepID=A0A8C1SX77_CYPCA